MLGQEGVELAMSYWILPVLGLMPPFKGWLSIYGEVGCLWG